MSELKEKLARARSRASSANVVDANGNLSPVKLSGGSQDEGYCGGKRRSSLSRISKDELHPLNGNFESGMPPEARQTQEQWKKKQQEQQEQQEQQQQQQQQQQQRRWQEEPQQQNSSNKPPRSSLHPSIPSLRSMLKSSASSSSSAEISSLASEKSPSRWAFRSKNKTANKKSIFDDDDDEEEEAYSASVGAKSTTDAILVKNLQAENRKLRELLNSKAAEIQRLTNHVNSLESKLNLRGLSLSPSSDRSLLGDGLGKRGSRTGTADELLESNLLKIGMDYRDVDVGEVMEGEGEGGGLFGGDELEGIEGGELPDNIDSASSAFVKKSSSEVEGWQDGRRKSTKAIDYGLLSKNAGENDANDALFGSSGSAGSSGAGGTDSRKNSRSNSVGSTGGGKQCTYKEFLEDLMKPESADLVDFVRRFIGSVLGPNGDGTPPLNSQLGKCDYEFYGSKDLRMRCSGFSYQMEISFEEHEAWRDRGEATLISARNGLEKYVMTKIADLAFKGEIDDEQDRRLMRRCKLLSFITPEMLEIKPEQYNETVLQIAQEELRKINSYRSPGDKVSCIVRCCSVVFSALNLARGKQKEGEEVSRAGADDFLPVFILVVLKANVPRLISNSDYIEHYRNRADLMSKSGYCFANLRSAIEFILTADHSVFGNVEKSEFDRMMARAEAALDEK